MAVARKQVTVHYRKLDREPGFPAASLESLIRSALNQPINGQPIRSRYPHRIHSLGDDNYFINTFTDQAPDGTPLVFGDIIHFTKGHLQALFRVDPNQGPSAPVEQMEAPAQREYVHSQMFWMIKGDHAFILQSISLRTEDLENYFNWILSTKTNTINNGSRVVLATKFDVELVGDDLNNIKEIVVGGIAEPVQREDVEPPQENPRDVVVPGQIEQVLNAGWSKARDVLKLIVETDARVDRIMEAVPADADLEVSVHIGYKTKKRSINRAALKEIETGLRNLPDGQLSITTKGSKKSIDGSVRLHHKGNVSLLKKLREQEEISGSLFDPNDVLRIMVEAYNQFLRSRKIAP